MSVKNAGRPAQLENSRRQNPRKTGDNPALESSVNAVAAVVHCGLSCLA